MDTKINTSTNPVIFNVLNNTLSSKHVRLFNKPVIPEGVAIECLYENVGYEDIVDLMRWNGFGVDKIRLETEFSLKDKPVEVLFTKYSIQGTKYEVKLKFKASEEQANFNVAEISNLDLHFDGFTSLEFTAPEYMLFYLYPKKTNDGIQ